MNAVVETLAVLQTAADPAARRDADRFLSEFQKSPQAWLVAGQLLQSADAGQRLFAAQTLRHKIVMDLAQLSLAERADLRDSIAAVFPQDRPVSRTLASCVANLVAQTPEWDTEFRALVTHFVAKHPAVALHLLIAFPVDLGHGSKLPLQVTLPALPPKRHELAARRQALVTANGDFVLNSLVQLVQSAGQDTRTHRLICVAFREWLTEFTLESLCNSPIVEYAFDALVSADDDLVEAAAELACELIQRSSVNIDAYKPIIARIFPKLAVLKDKLVSIDPDDSENDEFVRAVNSVFAEAGESYLGAIIEHFDAFSVVLDGIIACVKTTTDLDNAAMSFQFWTLLTEEIVLPKHEQIRHRFNQVYLVLFSAILAQLQYPDDFDARSAQEKESFRDFRHTIGDVLKSCVLVLGEQTALAQAYALLQRFAHDTALLQTAKWQEIEAALFSLRAMGKRISTQESQVLPEIMKLLPALPNHLKIRYAAILVIGRYSDWTMAHPEFIPAQLNYIWAGFDNSETVAAAALAFKFLCQSCGEAMIAYLDQMDAFYTQAIRSLVIEDQQEITEAISHIIAKTPIASMLAYLQKFCLPIAQRLVEISHHAKPEDATQVVAETAHLLDLLRIFFTYIRPDIPLTEAHPSMLIIKDLMPVFTTLITNYGAQANFAEKFTRCIRYAMSSYRFHLQPVLAQILQMVVYTISATHVADYLWLAKHCVKEYANNDFDENGRMVADFVQKVIEIVTARVFSGAQTLDDVPDVVDDFFQFLKAFAEDVPGVFFSPEFFKQAMQLAISTLSGTGHPESLYSVIDFVKTAVCLMVPDHEDFNYNLPSELRDPNLAAIRDDLGLRLVSALFGGLVGEFPMDVIRDVASLMREFALLVPCEMIDAWVSRVVGDINISQAEKTEFLQKFRGLLGDSDYKRLKSAIQDFTAQVRRSNLVKMRAQ